MTSNNYFCIFCPQKEFFKKDLKDHIVGHHKCPNNSSTSSAVNEWTTGGQTLEDITQSLIDYCSQLETTLSDKKSKRRRDKKYLPLNTCPELLLGCRLCDHIIGYYKLKTFDRKSKPFKEQCICGNNDTNTGLTDLKCTQCHHHFHWECIYGSEYSGHDSTNFLCDYCQKIEFCINHLNDMKPMDQLRHYRQHWDYRPYKCVYNQKCDQSFYFYPLFIDHLKNDHKLSQDWIQNASQSLYTYQKVQELEEHLELKGLKSELLTISTTDNDSHKKDNKNVSSVGVSTERQSASIPVTSGSGTDQTGGANKSVDKIGSNSGAAADRNPTGLASTPVFKTPVTSVYNVLTPGLPSDPKPSTSATTQSETVVNLDNNCKLPDGLATDLIENINQLIEIKKDSKDQKEKFAFNHSLLVILRKLKALSAKDEKQIKDYLLNKFAPNREVMAERIRVLNNLLDPNIKHKLPEGLSPDLVTKVNEFNKIKHYMFGTQTEHELFNKTLLEICRKSLELSVELNNSMLDCMAAILSSGRQKLVELQNKLIASGQSSKPNVKLPDGLPLITRAQIEQLIKMKRNMTGTIAQREVFDSHLLKLLKYSLEHYSVEVQNQFISYLSFNMNDDKELFIEKVGKHLSDLLPSHLTDAQNVLQNYMNDVNQTPATSGQPSESSTQSSDALIVPIGGQQSGALGQITDRSVNPNPGQSVNPTNVSTVPIPTAPVTRLPVPTKPVPTSVAITTVPQSCDLNNYSIPKYKLPDRLSQDLKDNIKELIEVKDVETQLFETRFQCALFDRRLLKIIEKCRELSAEDRLQVYGYLSSNLPVSKEQFNEKVVKLTVDYLECCLKTSIASLKKSVNEITAEVKANYQKSVDEFKRKQKKGIPDNSLPIKAFPFPDTIKRHFNDSIVYKYEIFELTLASDPDLKLQDYLYDFIQYQILSIWPNGWMKIETLVQRLKAIIKQKSPQKTNQLSANTVTPIPINPILSATSADILKTTSTATTAQSIATPKPVATSANNSSTPVTTVPTATPLVISTPDITRNSTTSSAPVTTANIPTPKGTTTPTIQMVKLLPPSGTPVPVIRTVPKPSPCVLTPEAIAEAHRRTARPAAPVANTGQFIRPRATGPTLHRGPTSLLIPVVNNGKQGFLVSVPVPSGQPRVVAVPNVIRIPIPVVSSTAQPLTNAPKAPNLPVTTVSTTTTAVVTPAPVATVTNRLLLAPKPSPAIPTVKKALPAPTVPTKPVATETVVPQQISSVSKATKRTAGEELGSESDQSLTKRARIDALSSPALTLAINNIKSMIESLTQNNNNMNSGTIGAKPPQIGFEFRPELNKQLFTAVVEIQRLCQQLKDRDVGVSIVDFKSLVETEIFPLFPKEFMTLSDLWLKLNTIMKERKQPVPQTATVAVQPKATPAPDLNANALNVSTNSEDQMDWTLIPNTSTSSAQGLKITVRRSSQPRRMSTDQTTDHFIQVFNQWITECQAVKSPYLPQINDRVVYLRAAKHEYNRALRERKLTEWTLNEFFKIQKYSQNYCNQFETIFATVRDIHYQSEPIHSVKLQLQELDPKTYQSINKYFEVVYTRLEDVSDFLILRSIYQKSLNHNWKVGESFKTSITNGHFWTYGMVVNERPFSDEFPTSIFKKFEVNYADNRTGHLSPWDLDYFDPKSNVETVFPVLPIERQSFYETVVEDWPEGLLGSGGGMETPFQIGQLAHIRLNTAFEQILATPEGQLFLSNEELFKDCDPKPVYPIDLTLIEKRIGNCFYRRSAQIKFDLNYLTRNIETYLVTEQSEEILIKCRQITKIFCDFIDSNIYSNSDILDFYNEVFNCLPPTEAISDDESDDDIEIIKVSDKNLLIENSVTTDANGSSINTGANDPDVRITTTIQTVIESDENPVINKRIFDLKEEEEDFEQISNESFQSIDESNEISDPKSGEFEDILSESTSLITNDDTMADISDNLNDMNDTETPVRLEDSIKSDLSAKRVVSVDTESQTVTIVSKTSETQTMIRQTIDIEVQTAQQVNKLSVRSIDSQTDCQTIERNDSQTPRAVDLEATNPKTLPDHSHEHESEPKVFLCVFCSTNTYFLDKSQAEDHYRQHMAVVIGCEICFANHNTLKGFQKHSEHWKDESNVLNIKQYFLALDWIHQFLEFQMTDTFSELWRIRNEFCPVCTAIKLMSSQISMRQLSTGVDNLPFDQHLRQHMNYNNVYECNDCSTDGQTYKYCFNLSDAKHHLRTHQTDVPFDSIDDQLIETAFKVNETVGPNLEDYLKTFTDFNQKILHFYERNSLE